MTNIPWRGKETKSSHKVFVATKPGEYVSVNQMTSTELGFVTQLKGKLTKKRYCCATIFIEHYSRLQYIHPQVDDSSIETVAAKRDFETFAAQHGVKSSTITATMGNSQTTPSNGHATTPASNLPSVA
jgi:hypothetical protein